MFLLCFFSLFCALVIVTTVLGGGGGVYGVIVLVVVVVVFVCLMLHLLLLPFVEALYCVFFHLHLRGMDFCGPWRFSFIVFFGFAPVYSPARGHVCVLASTHIHTHTPPPSPILRESVDFIYVLGFLFQCTHAARTCIMCARKRVRFAGFVYFRLL